MAPRRGGSGSSGGSGSIACEYCSEKYPLFGKGWRDPYTTAYFAINCICLLLLILCLVGARYYSRWRSARGYLGKVGQWTYIGAVLAEAINVILAIVWTALHEARATVTYSYVVIQVFTSAFYYLASILIIVLLARFIEDGSSSGKRMLSMPIKVVVILLSLLATAAVALIITDVAYLLNPSSTDLYYSIYGFSNITTVVDLTFNALYLLTVIGLTTVFAKTALVYAGQSVYRALLAITIFLVFVWAVFSVASSALSTASFYGKTYVNGANRVAARQFTEAFSILSTVLQTVALLLFAFLARSATRNVAVRPKNEPYIAQ